MDQVIVFSTLGLALLLFIWGKLRHDVTAIICLLVLVVFGIIAPDDAFSGFAHPAVVTVAMILIVSQGLKNSGLIDLIGQWVLKLGANITLQIGVMSLIVCFASGFMNNVGALAVMMPVAIHIAHKSGYSPSLILMPIACASLLGGMTTLIGTPPNIIIATFRSDAVGAPFQMFDFSPVGILISIVGIAFVTLLGWRLLPRRNSTEQMGTKFSIDEYITEVVVVEESKLLGKRLHEAYKEYFSDVQLLSLVRDKNLFYAPRQGMKLKLGDILTIEAEASDLKAFLEKTKTKLEGHGREEVVEGQEDIKIVEVVVMRDAYIEKKTTAQIRLRTRFGINLLAIARQNQNIRKRLDRVAFKAGDVLLLQGESTKINEVVSTLGCLPLADRGFQFNTSKKLAGTLAIFVGAIFLIVFGLLPVQVAFTLAATAMVLTSIIPLNEVYRSVDWPVIVLLGAMLPLGTALELSGGAATIAEYIFLVGVDFPPWVTLAFLLVSTMLLSNIINNAATAVLMAPIGIGLAETMGLSVDAFLMTIAIGASAAFLTPIGHQSNTLVMGPGGYVFRDFIKFGLPISVLIMLISIPLILYFWPL